MKTRKVTGCWFAAVEGLPGVVGLPGTVKNLSTWVRSRETVRTAWPRSCTSSTLMLYRRAAPPVWLASNSNDCPLASLRGIVSVDPGDASLLLADAPTPVGAAGVATACE